MLRLPVLVAVACLFLVPSGHAGEVYPRGSDFIAADFAFGALAGAAAMAPDGTFVVAWDEFFSGKNARGFDVDGNGGAAWNFDGLSSPEPHSLDVAAFGTGEFVVAWESYNAAFEPALLARRFELGGTPLGPEVEVAAGSDGSIPRQPVVDAWAAFSGYVLVWTDQAGGPPPGDDSNILLDAVPGWSMTGTIQVNTYTTGVQDEPALSVGADSTFVVAWRSAGSGDTDHSGTSIQSRRFSSNGFPGPQFQVNAVTTGSQENPDVAVAADGRFLLVWDGPSTGSDLDRSIQGRLFGPNLLPLTGDFQINKVTVGEQSEPAVVVRYDGSFLVVWRSSAGVWARVVEADGTPAGGEQRVNTTATDLYFDPSVATSHEGHFVVTWDTEDDFDYGGYRRARLLEELGPSIFGDGFESGDTSAWE